MPDNRLKDFFLQAVELQQAKEYDAAIKIWRAIITFHPDYIPALNNMAIALRHLGRIAEAEAVLRTSLERAPESVELLISLARTLSHWGVFDEAEEALKKAIGLAPKDPRPAYAMGRLLEDNQNSMAAMAAYQMAIDIDANYAPALMALGLGWKVRGETKQSEKLLRQAIKIRPHFPPSHFQLALMLLANGEFNEGWREFEWRLAMDGLQIIDPGMPRWEGEDLAGRRLLICCEQGMGEAIQFSRLIKLITNGTTIFQCPPAMRQIFAASRIADQVVEIGEIVPQADLWLPLLSLPMILNININNIKPIRPYLRADPSRLAPWRVMVDNNIYNQSTRHDVKNILIGIAWQASSPPHENRERSIPLLAFGPLANLENINLISLQKGAGRNEIAQVDFNIIDMTDGMDEGEGAFLDTAAIIENLDMVITVDGAIAHLAGGLGKKTYVLVPDLMDWRWANKGGNISPWYNDIILWPKNDMEWIDVIEKYCKNIKFI